MTPCSPRTIDVLNTRGSEGIGRGLAARYSHAGGQVLITGRSPPKPKQAALDLPEQMTVVNDISKPEEREAFADHVRAHLPGLSVLINNAGVQRHLTSFFDTLARFMRNPYKV